MKENKKNLVRWIILLPSSLIAGILATFPLHWILSLQSLSDGGFMGFIVLSPEGFNTIERILTPFVVAIVYLLAGVEIAPSHKWKTAIVLTVTYVILAVGTFLFAISSGWELTFGSRLLAPILGLLLGLYIVRHKHRSTSSSKKS